MLTNQNFVLALPESILSSYRSSNESWEEAKGFILQNTDPLLQYFGCSVYIDWIASRWKLVPDANKAELGLFLFETIIQRQKVRSFFQLRSPSQSKPHRALSKAASETNSLTLCFVTFLD